MKTDAELEREIREALRYDGAVHHSHIGVTVEEGVVKLQGTVPGASEQWEAERVVQQIEGVRAVINHLEVAPPVV
jgi:osmotically-inducible protein OsmY